MLLAQISDTHINAPGNPPVAGAEPAAALRRAVDFLNAFDPAPDAVIATGDLVDRGSVEEYVALRAELDRLRPPLYLIPGNHDSREGIRAIFPDHGYLPASGFLHYVIQDWPLRLVALDTLVPGQPNGELCKERLEWVDARLGEAPEQPTLILMHHPPFKSGIETMDGMRCKGGSKLGAIVERHPQVERVVCGHIHRPMTIRWHGSTVVTAPSTVVQMELELRPGARGGHIHEPPGCLLHLWRPKVGLVTHVTAIGSYPGTSSV
jgi:Icc protein